MKNSPTISNVNYFYPRPELPGADLPRAGAAVRGVQRAVHPDEACAGSGGRRGLQLRPGRRGGRLPAAERVPAPGRLLPAAARLRPGLPAHAHQPRPGSTAAKTATTTQRRRRGLGQR